MMKMKGKGKNLDGKVTEIKEGVGLKGRNMEGRNVQQNGKGQEGMNRDRCIVEW